MEDALEMDFGFNDVEIENDDVLEPSGDAAVTQVQEAPEETPAEEAPSEKEEEVEQKEEEEEEEEKDGETAVAMCETIAKVEETLPLNTPEQQQPTIFRVDKATLQDHLNQVRSFPKKTDVKHPEVPKFTGTENKLNATADDYNYVKFSKKGEEKISANGYLLGDRKYIFSTFTLPGRGKKLYVLANEAAKTLNLRDAFLLLNKSKNLSKISASEDDRKFLTEANFNISKIKSRTVGLVTARGLFMNYGARVIASGKRVQDDYWEDEAVEQGFTDKDQVFIVEKNYNHPGRSHQKKEDRPKRSATSSTMVMPIPPLEERMEYLANSSSGQPTQVLPGQGISGGLELASISSIPKYRGDSHSNFKQNKALMNLMDSSSNLIPTPNAVTATHSLPINDAWAGKRSNSGLPYYKSNITKRINSEDADDLKEIEYLHGMVETNTYINSARQPRNRMWQFYWQAKSGVELGLTKENSADFFKAKEEFLKQEETEVRYNEYLNCDQVMTKKRRPNPNFLGRSNIDGHKPPYAERPPQPVPEPLQAMGMQHPGAIPNVAQGVPGGQGAYIPGMIPSRPPMPHIPRPY